MQISAVPRHSDGERVPERAWEWVARVSLRALRSLRESLDVSYGRVNTSPFVTGLVVLR